LDRTTDGRGAIRNFTLEQVKALDAGYHWSADKGLTHPFRGQGIQVPTLTEVFQAFPETRLNLEIKPLSPEVAATMCRSIRSFNRETNVLVASVHQEAMDAFRAHCPEVATSATFKEVLSFVVLNRFFLGGLYRPRAEAFQVIPKAGAIEILTPRFITTAKRLNVRIHVWTINDPDELERFLAMGVDGIMTDFPDRLLEIIPGSGVKPDPTERQ
jgi:glycerophosphoryl diester phosphodiesterase